MFVKVSCGSSYSLGHRYSFTFPFLLGSDWVKLKVAGAAHCSHPGDEQEVRVVGRRACVEHCLLLWSSRRAAAAASAARDATAQRG